LICYCISLHVNKTVITWYGNIAVASLMHIYRSFECRVSQWRGVAMLQQYRGTQCPLKYNVKGKCRNCGN